MAAEARRGGAAKRKGRRKRPTWKRACLRSLPLLRGVGQSQGGSSSVHAATSFADGGRGEGRCLPSAPAAPEDVVAAVVAAAGDGVMCCPADVVLRGCGLCGLSVLGSAMAVRVAPGAGGVVTMVVVGIVIPRCDQLVASNPRSAAVEAGVVVLAAVGAREVGA